MNGEDIVDGSTTIWDASNGYVPKAQIQNLVASDVGLGNVENEPQVAESGDTMTGNLDFGGSYRITNLADPTNAQDAATRSWINSNDDDASTKCKSGNVLFGNGSCGVIEGGDGYLPNDPATSSVYLGDNRIFNTAGIRLRESGEIQLGTDSNGYNNDIIIEDSEFSGAVTASDDPDRDLNMEADGDIILTSDMDDSSGGGIPGYSCYISGSDGSWNCDGTKNWIHSLNSTHDAYYTAQESPDVRAVYEGEAHVVDSKKIELPSHFSKTVSDTEPMLRAQVTPRGTLTDTAAMEVTDDYIEIAVQNETDVNFRVTGIREGYEDKQVVRSKTEE